MSLPRLAGAAAVAGALVLSALVPPAAAAEEPPPSGPPLVVDDPGFEPPVLSGDETPAELGLPGPEPLMPPAAGEPPIGIDVDATAVKCKNKSRATIAKTYHRGPAEVYLRCGTKNWGFRHIAAKGRWNAAFDQKISKTVWSGMITTDLPGQRIYEDMRPSCPPKSEFKVITNPDEYNKDWRINPQGIITAYKNNKAVSEPAAC